MSDGETDLHKIIQGMDPVLNIGEYVFITIPENSEFRIDFENVHSSIREKEGLSIIVDRSYADSHSLYYEGVWSWISLNIHSSLHAIGLISLVSQSFAQEELSCNIVAGFHHDHIFIQKEKAKDAMKVLLEISKA